MVRTERYTKNNISAIIPTVIRVTFAVPLLPTSNWSEMSGAAPVT
ncbi:Uncharacterised protein [Mycobacterium tuberculosis]|nr:Uncharacterised protein [Mycobacterium tuberculosis]